MGGGTLLFPDLGKHCQHPDCHQLDFLPFKCNRCQKVFCVEHRSYTSHECPKPDDKSRKVIVCEICSTAIETTGLSSKEEAIVKEKHANSKACDPSKKNKPQCPVKRCKERLTFSNSTVCKCCNVKLCLKHRLLIDHECSSGNYFVAKAYAKGGFNSKYLDALAARKGKDCAKSSRDKVSSPTSSRSVQAF